MKSDTKAFLVLADISGYTKFMRNHSASTSHAKQIIVHLLKSIMNASRLPLKVAELEGDAVFMYARTSENPRKETAEQILRQTGRMWERFNETKAELAAMRVCSCEACAQVGDLKLKTVVHVGNVSIERIGRFEKLFGIDVILAHRMLKNSLHSAEYIMMTDAVYDCVADTLGVVVERRTETFEGFDDVATVVLSPGSLVGRELVHERRRPSVQARAKWWLSMVTQTSLDLLGLRKSGGSFANLPA